MPQSTQISGAPGWENFRQQLCQIEPTGENGFEGLVARLFEAETGKIFYLARSGDQPAGDAYSPSAAISLQTKRYDNTSFVENTIIGEIDRVLGENPDLDLYVLAATRPMAQLSARLERKSKETGLDILPLYLNDEITEFGSLCLKHWALTSKWIPNLNEEWQSWAASEATKPEANSAMLRLRDSLNALATQNFVSAAARQQLKKHFEGEGYGARTHNKIFLSQAIDRNSTKAKLKEWWSRDESPNAVLRGEEGMGKTWLAAAFAHDLYAESPGQVIFWFDSSTWARCGTVEVLVKTALEQAFLGDDVLRKRIFRKIFFSWSKPILLILDGANERGAKQAVDNLLRDYESHANKLRTQIRFLFTSRPLSLLGGGDGCIWNGCEVVEVMPFSNAEFRQALEVVAPGLAVESFTPGVSNFATIPRYFKLCIELHERLASLSNITKEVILWEDLRRKLSQGDPQIERVAEELAGSPEDILAHLAEQIGWPENGQVTIATAKITQIFPHFSNVRQDLKEQRILLSADFDFAKLSQEHVVLGWALLLRKLAVKHSEAPLEQIQELLLSKLEPAASNDQKVRAVYLAALLLFLDENQVAETRNSKVALLGLWLSNHNAAVDLDALQFFLKTDISAYVLAIEQQFLSYMHGGFEASLIEPLAINWRDQIHDIEFMRSTLCRWLKFIYPGDASGSENGDKEPPQYFVKANSREQVRMSYIAISIISLRFEVSLLDELLKCFESAHYCYEDHISGDKKFRLSIKDVYQPLGILLRWTCTEAVIPNLVQLSTGVSAVSNGKDDLLWFTRLLRLNELPVELGPAKDIYSGGYSPAAETIDSFLQALRAKDLTRCRGLGYCNLSSLAVWPLSEQPTGDDIAYLASECRRLADLVFVDIGRVDTHEYRIIEDLLPWLAKLSPMEFHKLYSEIWGKTMISREPAFAIMRLDEVLPFDDYGGTLVQTVLNEKERIVESERLSAMVDSLTCLMLLYGQIEQIDEWLTAIESKAFTRGGSPLIGLLPIPAALEKLGSPDLSELARERFSKLHDEAKAHPDNKVLKTAARHWLQIFAYTSRSNSKDWKWALPIADDAIDDEELGFPLLIILSKNINAENFNDALGHPALKRFHLGFNAWRWAENLDANASNPFTFQDLNKITSYTVSGEILFQAGNDEELKKWGASLSAFALSVIGNRPESRPLRTRLKFEVNADLRSEGIGFQSPKPGRSSMHSILSSSWGVDRQHQSPKVEQADLDRECNRYHEDLAEIRKSQPRELFEFNAASALIRWGELEPDKFSIFAVNFLTQLIEDQGNELIDLHYFAAVLKIGLLRIRPDDALRVVISVDRGIRLHVTTFGGSIDWDAFELWSRKVNQHKQILSIRRQVLIDAQDDESLFWCSAAAYAGGNSAQMEQLAVELTHSIQAKERALGVTLLGFQGSEVAKIRLSELKKSDLSFWVQGQIIWALDVCVLEQACKTRYGEILRTTSLPNLIAGLAEMQMAFTPLARAWRSEIEQEVNWASRSQQLKCYLELFWYNWNNTSSRTENITVLGRKLKEKCRGEKLSQGVTDKQSPWWKP